MGIAERKQREKEDMRQLILDTAKRLFTERGYESVSIRNIAEVIEYSPATIYLYYKDKNELLHSLHLEGFRLMLSQMQGVAQVEDPFERLAALSEVYIRFAHENPELYDLMFIMTAPMDYLSDGEKWGMGEETFGFLVSIIAACQQQGRFQGKDAFQLAFYCWSTVHGLVSLEIRQRTRVCKDDVLRGCLVEEGLKYFIEAMRKL